MLVRPYYLVLLFSGDGKTVPVVSPDPGLEREWSKGTDYYKVIAWERPFPLWLAEAICQELTLLLADANRRRLFSPAKAGRIIGKLARERGWPGAGRWYEPPDRPVFPGLLSKRESFARPPAGPGRPVVFLAGTGGVFIPDGILRDGGGFGIPGPP